MVRMDEKPLTRERVAELFDIPFEALTITPEEAAFIRHREELKRRIAEASEMFFAAFVREIDAVMLRESTDR